MRGRLVVKGRVPVPGKACAHALRSHPRPADAASVRKTISPRLWMPPHPPLQVSCIARFSIDHTLWNMPCIPKSPWASALTSPQGKIAQCVVKAVRTRGAIGGTQRPTRPLRMASAARSPPDRCGERGVVNQEAARGLYMPTEPSSALSPDLRLRHRWHRTQHGQEARAYVLAMDSYGIVLQTVTK